MKPHTEPSEPTKPPLVEHSDYHLPLELLLQGCGEICEIDKVGTPSLFFNYIEKAVDCKGLMSNEAIDAPMQSKTPPATIPEALIKHFTYNGKVELGFYPGSPLNSRYLASNAMQSEWSKEEVEDMRQKCTDGILHGTYGVQETNIAKQGLQKMDLAGKHVLVIGSELPWMEACILSLGAKHVSTIEYGAITSKHPQISTYTPEQIRRNHTFFYEKFDAVASWSSLEHSGLGRYGDSMNPWGDRQAVARAWCMVKPGGGMLLAVPSPRDFIEYNAHRNYGPIQYPHLTANWQQVWQGPNHGAGWNTVTVFKKPSPTFSKLRKLQSGSMTETWLEECQHHLCTPNQWPADFYMCDPTRREWKLTFATVIPKDDNDDSVPEQENSPLNHAHVAWSGSIQRGLNSLHLAQGSWNINPSHRKFLGDVIWTDNCPALRDYVRKSNYFQNRKGFLICGAVGMTFENIEDQTDDNIGFIITPSTWVFDGLRGKYSFNHVPEARIRVIVSGVDTDYFKPTEDDYAKRKEKLKVIVYVKNFDDATVISSTVDSLTKQGVEVVKFVYGSYSLENFKKDLETTSISIIFSGTESQGIALAEIWSMDVPTLVYEVNPSHPFHYFQRTWYQAVESPYLNNLNGYRWNNVDKLVNDIIHKRHHWPFNPRYYVLNTMSDKIAMWNTLKAIECEWQRRYGN